MSFNIITLVFSLPFILFGAITLAIAIAMYRANYKFQKNGILTTGTVVSSETGTDDDGDTTYYCVIKFWTRTETAIEFKHFIFQNKIPDYPVSQEVLVFYDPENPRTAKIKSNRSIWLVPVGLGLFSIPFFLIGIGVLTGDVFVQPS